MPLIRPQISVDAIQLKVSLKFDPSTPPTSKLVVFGDRADGLTVWKETEYQNVGQAYEISLADMDRCPNAILPGPHRITAVLKNGTESASDSCEFSITEESLSIFWETRIRKISTVLQSNVAALSKLNMEVDTLRGLFNAFPKKAVILDEAAKLIDQRLTNSVAALEKKLTEAITKANIAVAGNTTPQIEREVEEKVLESTAALKSSMQPELDSLKAEIASLKTQLANIGQRPAERPVQSGSGIPYWQTVLNTLLLLGVVLIPTTYILCKNQQATAPMHGAILPAAEAAKPMVVAEEVRDGAKSTSTTVLPSKFTGAAIIGNGNTNNVVLGQGAMIITGSNMPAGIFGNPFWKPWPSHMKATKTLGVVPSATYTLWTTNLPPDSCSQVTINDGEVIQIIVRPGCSITPDFNDLEKFRVYFGNNVECHEFKNWEDPTSPDAKGGPVQFRVRKLPWTPGPLTFHFRILEKLP